MRGKEIQNVVFVKDWCCSRLDYNAVTTITGFQNDGMYSSNEHMIHGIVLSFVLH